MNQLFVEINGDYSLLDKYFIKNNIKKIFIVCGKSYNNLSIKKYLDEISNKMDICLEFFTEFEPNPVYESVVNGVLKFKNSNSDLILAIGGGSALDVAKAIKLFSTLDDSKNYLEQTIIENDVLLWAMPTTAGTGSESTKFSVIYYKGEKQSINHKSLIPSLVIMDYTVLNSLPIYQKKVTMLDALSHAIESYWSVNSTDESIKLSRQAIKKILKYKDGYLNNTPEGNKGMLYASNVAGQAINITQTTAGHAMCYKLTSLYNIPHGHATALCLPKLFRYMIDNTDKCSDNRSESYLKQIFNDIADSLNCKSPYEAVDFLENLIDSLELENPKAKSDEDIIILTNSVNAERLKNNPVLLDKDAINNLYCEILNVEKK